MYLFLLILKIEPNIFVKMSFCVCNNQKFNWLYFWVIIKDYQTKITDEAFRNAISLNVKIN